jgi:hypothetical protein
LQVTSPISGTVVTHRVKDLLGSYLKPGTVIAEVIDPASMRARVYVSEAELHKLRSVHGVALLASSEWMPVEGTFLKISPAATEVAPGLIPAEDFSGLHPPTYFAVDVAIPASAALPYGMTGTAKIFGDRRSIAGSVFTPLLHAIASRIW